MPCLLPRLEWQSFLNIVCSSSESYQLSAFLFPVTNIIVKKQGPKRRLLGSRANGNCPQPPLEYRFVPALNAAQEAVDAQEAPYLGGVSLSPTVKMEFDLDQIEYMARQHCSFKEIAQFYRCSEATIQLRYKEDADFRAAMDKGRFHTVEIIRRKQIESATDGNTQMLMWLGKQMLGQTEKADVDKMSRAQPINIQINAPVSIESDKIDPIDLTPDDYSAND